MQFDERTEKNLATLDPKAERRFRKWLEDATQVAKDNDCELKVISGNRTWKEQDEKYKIGRRGIKGEKPVTKARGGQSNHNFGIAIDCGLFQNGKYIDEEKPEMARDIYRKIARDIDEYGMEWGGTWAMQDDPHFQISSPLTTTQKRNLFIKNGSVL